MRIKKTSQYIEGGAGLPSYFIDEIDTGMKWIDGKTIYRKVFNIGTISTSPYFYNTNFSSSEIGTFINYYCIANRSDGSSIIIPYVNDEINYQIACRIINQSSNKVILIQYNTSTLGNITNVYAILEYTKTTD